MNKKDLPTVLWCLLVVLLVLLALLYNHCYSQMEWGGKENRRVADFLFFPLRAWELVRRLKKK